MAEYTLTKYKEAISDLHACLDVEAWEMVEEKTKEIAMAIHDELWHKVE